MHLNLWSPPDPADEEFHARISAETGVDVAALYREDAPRLRRFFGRRTHRAESIPDLIQSAFARLLGLDRQAREVLAEPRAWRFGRHHQLGGSA